jgi:hypothetical protein
MDPISVLLGVVFPKLLFIGLGLALAIVGPTGFLIARGCFCLAALDLLALTTWWLYTSEPCRMETCNRDSSGCSYRRSFA